MEAVSMIHVTTMTVSNFMKYVIYQTKQLGAVKEDSLSIIESLV